MPPTASTLPDTDVVHRMIFSSDVKRILHEFRIRRAYLFGSYARREETSESDVDLLIEWASPLDIYSYMDLKETLENVLGARIDLVPRKSVKSFAREEIEREKVLIMDISYE